MAFGLFSDPAMYITDVSGIIITKPTSVPSLNCSGSCACGTLSSSGYLPDPHTMVAGFETGVLQSYGAAILSLIAPTNGNAEIFMGSISNSDVGKIEAIGAFGFEPTKLQFSVERDSEAYIKRHNERNRNKLGHRRQSQRYGQRDGAQCATGSHFGVGQRSLPYCSWDRKCGQPDEGYKFNERRRHNVCIRFYQLPARPSELHKCSWLRRPQHHSHHWLHTGGSGDLGPARIQACRA